jgi:hypothetical protein
LLSFVEVGLQLVFAQLGPLLDWISRVLVTFGTWLGVWIERMGEWVTATSTHLGRAMAAWLGYAVEAKLRPAIHVLVTELFTKLGTVVLGMLQGLGTVLLEGGRWIGTWIVRGAMLALGDLWKGLGLPGRAPAPPPAPEQPDVGRILERSFSQSAFVLKGFFDKVPPPPVPAEPKLPRRPRFESPKLELPSLPGGQGEPTGTRPPTAERPELTLPGPPGTTQAPSRAAVTTGHPPAGARPPRAVGPTGTPSQVTLNGGITIQITTATLDLEHAEETARRLGSHLLEELERLSDLQAFRRGLPTPVGG